MHGAAVVSGLPCWRALAPASHKPTYRYGTPTLHRRKGTSKEQDSDPRPSPPVPPRSSAGADQIGLLRHEEAVAEMMKERPPKKKKTEDASSQQGFPARCLAYRDGGGLPPPPPRLGGLQDRFLSARRAGSHQSNSAGKISTHVVAAAAVCGLLGWSFRNRMRLKNFRLLLKGLTDGFVLGRFFKNPASAILHARSVKIPLASAPRPVRDSSSWSSSPGT